MNLDLEAEENKGRIIRWEEIGTDAIKADLEHAGGIRYVGRHTDLAWKWVRSKQEKPIVKNEDVMMIRPNLYGIGIDLRALWRKNEGEEIGSDVSDLRSNYH